VAFLELGKEEEVALLLLLEHQLLLFSGPMVVQQAMSAVQSLAIVILNLLG